MYSRAQERNTLLPMRPQFPLLIHLLDSHRIVGYVSVSTHNLIDMPKQNKTAISVIEKWEVETLRLTAFPAPSTQIGEGDWWTSLLGEPPDKRTSSPKKGVLQEEGSF